MKNRQNYQKTEQSVVKSQNLSQKKMEFPYENINNYPQTVNRKYANHSPTNLEKERIQVDMSLNIKKMKSSKQFSRNLQNFKKDGKKQPMEDFWICPACNYINENSMTKCFKCKQPNQKQTIKSKYTEYNQKIQNPEQKINPGLILFDSEKITQMENENFQRNFNIKKSNTNLNPGINTNYNILNTNSCQNCVPISKKIFNEKEIIFKPKTTVTNKAKSKNSSPESKSISKRSGSSSNKTKDYESISERPSCRSNICSSKEKINGVGMIKNFKVTKGNKGMAYNRYEPINAKKKK